MCVDQRCQEITTPTGHCRGGCSGHGVCNSRGNCHCDAGYSPPDCSLPGLGGSVDSNVMSVLTGKLHEEVGVEDKLQLVSYVISELSSL